MIIFRYLAKEVYASVFAVTFVMVLVFLANQAIRWLSQAAVGDLATNTLLQLLGLQLPYLLGLLLPLGLFLGVLVSYSRLYADNEMTVLFAAGMSRWQLTRMTLVIATLIFLIVAVLMFVINPLIAAQKNKLIDSSTTGTFISTLVPGSFQETPAGDGVIYVQSLSGDKAIAEQLFIAKKTESADATGSWMIVSAKRGLQQTRGEDDDDTFIVAEEGYRYQGQAGKNDFKVTKFNQYGLRIDNQFDGGGDSRDTDAVSTLQLLKNPEQRLDYEAELQWRFSLPLSVFVLTLLAVAMSKVKPRQGRFHQLAPAVILYIIYANLIFIARDWVSHGTESGQLGLWWVHGIFFSVSLLIFFVQSDWPQRVLYRFQKASS